VGHRQRRVNVDDRRLRARPKAPGPRARLGDRAAQPLKAPGVDAVDDPKRGRVRGDLAEQVGLVAQRAEIGQAVAAIAEHHDQITQHHARIVRGGPLSRRCHRLRQRRGQPDPVGHPGQQRAARMSHHARGVRGDP